jgi:hypothetical protein
MQNGIRPMRKKAGWRKQEKRFSIFATEWRNKKRRKQAEKTIKIEWN